MVNFNLAAVDALVVLVSWAITCFSASNTAQCTSLERRGPRQDSAQVDELDGAQVDVHDVADDEVEHLEERAGAEVEWRRRRADCPNSGLTKPGAMDTAASTRSASRSAG